MGEIKWQDQEIRCPLQVSPLKQIHSACSFHQFLSDCCFVAAVLMQRFLPHDGLLFRHCEAFGSRPPSIAVVVVQHSL